MPRRKSVKEPELVIPVHNDEISEQIPEVLPLLPFCFVSIDKVSGDFTTSEGFDCADDAISALSMVADENHKYVVYKGKKHIISIDVLSRDYWLVNALKSALTRKE